MRTLEQVFYELSRIPDGSLWIRQDRPNQKYRYRYSHYGLRFCPLVPPELINTAIQLDTKRQHLQTEFDFLLNSVDSKAAAKYRKRLKAERRRQLAGILASHRLYKERYIYYTPHGDYVSSKSEALISMLLMLMGITFHYELPLEISNKQFIRPDFTLIINGQRYYYEHLGKTHEPNYMHTWKQRLAQYHANNIFENDLLLVTTESDKGLDLLAIGRQIEKFIQSKK
ncbi:MAG: hypothetical protein IJ315_06085 [Firmicutes bacterium]|nr:hypothetical protein [Bacillota bacterium]